MFLTLKKAIFFGIRLDTMNELTNEYTYARVAFSPWLQLQNKQRGKYVMLYIDMYEGGKGG